METKNSKIKFLAQLATNYFQEQSVVIITVLNPKTRELKYPYGRILDVNQIGVLLVNEKQSSFFDWNLIMGISKSKQKMDLSQVRDEDDETKWFDGYSPGDLK